MLVADAFSSFCLVDSDGPERDGSRSAKWAFRGRRYGAGRLGLATLVPWGLRAGGSWMRVKDIFDDLSTLARALREGPRARLKRPPATWSRR